MREALSRLTAVGLIREIRVIRAAEGPASCA
jgi:hypothetical protein